MAAVLGAATACASGGTRPGTAAPAAGSASRTSTATALDSLARQLVDDGAPGVIVRVDDGHGATIQIARQATWTVRDHVLTSQDQFRSTAADRARFQSAVVSGKLLPPAQVKEMETTVSEGSQTQDRYGLGIEHRLTPCGTVWGHDGQAAGYSAWDYTDDTGTRTVAVLATSIFGLAEPKTSVATRTLLNAAVCAMLDKPLPAGGRRSPTPLLSGPNSSRA
ncbi:MAG TPA: hypothetical protein VH372_07370 [Actinospica sp.]|nr:hypothetical protein [Actinospica sp.]